ncbi:MAG: hypothetical protein ABW043_19020 [Devosia sp.]|uniref:hypothetical protein n=1 Tax=Devosia sp. TaxID=1871048 RepID=UPI00339AAFA1
MSHKQSRETRTVANEPQLHKCEKNAAPGQQVAKDLRPALTEEGGIADMEKRREEREIFPPVSPEDDVAIAVAIDQHQVFGGLGRPVIAEHFEIGAGEPAGDCVVIGNHSHLSCREQRGSIWDERRCRIQFAKAQPKIEGLHIAAWGQIREAIARLGKDGPEQSQAMNPVVRQNAEGRNIAEADGTSLRLADGIKGQLNANDLLAIA